MDVRLVRGLLALHPDILPLFRIKKLIICKVDGIVEIFQERNRDGVGGNG